MNPIELHKIVGNRNDNKWQITLYNGQVINCVPIWYHQSTDIVDVSLISDKTSLKIRGEAIDFVQQIVPKQQHIFSVDFNSDRLGSYSGEYARKMIIIGAGASFGYSDDFTHSERKIYQPPLANQIFDSNFDSLLNGFQGAKNLATGFSHLSDLEKYLQDEWNGLQDNDTLDKQTVIQLVNFQFYLSALFLEISRVQKGNKSNYYLDLVRLINKYISSKKREEKILLVSFNYDLLLEEALETYNSQYHYGNVEDYVDYKKRSILLFKPHGSCNWFRKSSLINSKYIPSLPAKERSLLSEIQKAAKMVYESRFTLGQINQSLEEHTEVWKEEMLKNHLSFEHIPQLLIPYREKDDFSMPGIHEDILEHLMQGVDDILIIGWKGTEEKFKRLLKQKLGNKPINISYVNANDTSIENSFKELLPQATIQNLGALLKDCGSKPEWGTSPPSIFSNYIRYSKTEKNFFFQSSKAVVTV